MGEGSNEPRIRMCVAHMHPDMRRESEELCKGDTPLATPPSPRVINERGVGICGNRRVASLPVEAKLGVPLREETVHHASGSANVNNPR